MTDPCELTAVAQLELLEARTLSARELAVAHLDRIDRFDPALNAVVALDSSVGLRRAEAVDEARAAGNPVGPLAGLVTAHKDLTETADFPTTFGSPLFADHRPAADSLLVQRLVAAGVTSIGKTNVPEFGAGSHTVNEVYGPTRNPFDPSRSAGGSSGGAGAALAAGLVSIADGSDMGGSLRNPASWNNVVGFRNTRGVVPRVSPGNGWSTLGVEGCMARTVDDLALQLRVVARPDPRDPLARAVSWPEGPVPVPERRPRVAWSPTLGGLPVEPDVAGVLVAAVDRLADAGWEIVEAEPDFTGADETFETLRAWYFAHHGPGGLPTLDRVRFTVVEEIERGRALDGAAVAAAHAALTDCWHRAVAFFADVDFLLAPVSQCSPFPVEWDYPETVAGEPMERYLTWMRSASRITVLNTPAMSMPAGFTDEGFPVGMQLVGAPGADAELLGWAKAFETLLPTTPWVAPG